MRSEAKIREAVMSLIISKKDVNKITVSDIVKKAGVNRGTFYNHYQDVHDVMNQIENRFMDELLDKWNSFVNSDNHSFSSFVDELAKSVKECEEKYNLSFSEIVQNVPHSVFLDFRTKFKKVLEKEAEKINMDSKTKSASFIFLSNGIAGAYLDYFLGDSPFTLEELGAYSTNFVNHFYPKVNQ